MHDVCAGGNDHLRVHDEAGALHVLRVRSPVPVSLQGQLKLSEALTRAGVGVYVEKLGNRRIALYAKRRRQL